MDHYIAEPAWPTFQSRVRLQDGVFTYRYWQHQVMWVQGARAAGHYYMCGAIAKLLTNSKLGQVKRANADQSAFENGYSEIWRAFYAWQAAGKPSTFCYEDGCKIICAGGEG